MTWPANSLTFCPRSRALQLPAAVAPQSPPWGTSESSSAASRRPPSPPPSNAPLAVAMRLFHSRYSRFTAQRFCLSPQQEVLRSSTVHNMLCADAGLLKESAVAVRSHRQPCQSERCDLVIGEDARPQQQFAAGFAPPDNRKGFAMSKSTRNTGKNWSSEDSKQLRLLARKNTPTGVIGFKLGRTKSAIYARASQEGVPLKPTNQSPYNRRISR